MGVKQGVKLFDKAYLVIIIVIIRTIHLVQLAREFLSRITKNGICGTLVPKRTTIYTNICSLREIFYSVTLQWNFRISFRSTN